MEANLGGFSFARAVAAGSDAVRGAAVASAAASTAGGDACAESGVQSLKRKRPASEMQPLDMSKVSGSSGVRLQRVGRSSDELPEFWKKVKSEVAELSDNRTNTHTFPLTRLKRIAKHNDRIRMVTSEVPCILSLASAIFVREVSLRSWMFWKGKKRRTIQDKDVAGAVDSHGAHSLDFLVDIVSQTRKNAKNTVVVQGYRDEQHQTEASSVTIAAATAAAAAAAAAPGAVADAADAAAAAAAAPAAPEFVAIAAASAPAVAAPAAASAAAAAPAAAAAAAPAATTVLY